MTDDYPPPSRQESDWSRPTPYPTGPEAQPETKEVAKEQATAVGQGGQLRLVNMLLLWRRSRPGR